MPERIWRAMVVTPAKAVEAMGRIQYLIPPMPLAGSQPRCAEKSRISTSANQNPGMEVPISARPMLP